MEKFLGLKNDKLGIVLIKATAIYILFFLTLHLITKPIFATGIGSKEKYETVEISEIIFPTEIKPQNTSYIETGIDIRDKITDAEYELLLKVVEDETSGQSYLLKVAVAEVIVNRFQCGKYSKHLENILMQPGAFSGISSGSVYKKAPEESTISAVNAVLGGLRSGLLTEETYYFCVPETTKNKWMIENCIEVTQVDSTHFFQITADK